MSNTLYTLERHMNDTPSTGAWRRFLTACGSAGSQDQRNQVRFALLCLGWALSFVAALWLLRGDRNLPAALLALTIAIPAAVGIAAIAAYLSFLRNTDELLRKIQLEALAIGFGVYALLSMTYPLLEAAGLLVLEVGDLFAAVLFVWGGAQLYGARRYR